MVKNPPPNAGDMDRSLGWEDPLEEEMANCSSILVGKIPWTKGTWRATVQGIATEQLSMHTCIVTSRL